MTAVRQPPALCWYCAACKQSWTEACFHHQEFGFIPDAKPGVMCPQCQSTHVDAEPTGTIEPIDEVSARCRDCGAQLRISLEYKPA